MKMSLFFILTVIFSKILAEHEGSIVFFTEYFSVLGVGSVAFFRCKDKGENFKLNKQFSMKGITYNWINLEKYNELQAFRQMEAKFYKQGIVVDLKCPRSMDVLQMANENYFFLFHRSLTYWLILYPTTLPKNILENLIDSYIPKTTDLNKFLMEPYNEAKRQSTLFQINKKVNKEVLMNYKIPTFKTTQFTANETIFFKFLRFNILLNNKITIDIPALEQEVLYDLYHVYKTTTESRPKIQEVGKFIRIDKNDYKLVLNILEEKKNLENEILKGALAMYWPEEFTTIDDIATKAQDIWPKVSYPHVKHLSEDLNFRFVLRFFDNYGWSKNGSFSHLLGFLQSKKTDISGAAMAIRKDRMEFISFLVCPFPLETNLLFLEPPLPSVTNVFILPFAKSIWLSYGGIILLTILVMNLRTIFSKSVLSIQHNLNLSETGNYVLGSVCHQGLSSSPKSISDRIAILFLMLISISLFSAYSACIITLMQTSSSAISSLEDMTKSDFEVGIQNNFPFFQVFMQEASHPVEKEYYNKKLLKKDKKKIFFHQKEGVEKIRTGLFAFQVELSGAYHIIKRTYQEYEKCGLKELNFATKPPVCFNSLKDSPYKEIFAQRYLWQGETGLFDRTWTRWTEKKPKCEGSRLGYISIGMQEFRHVMFAFVYGVAAALIIFAVELLLKKKFF